ncbi:MAG: tRNA pseudouridine(38-40) synthase TruA [bacterium]|nr:tRNA pseudouridine(38-40) synthase TruA [bacterium]MCP4800751.1 tRNA pseudouridine(38-40) synthase TruA [bacterium]
MSHTVRIDLSYNGTQFHGFQIQTSLRSVQGVLKHHCSTLLDREAKPTGAGRTDTGVHALGQVCSLDQLSKDEVERVKMVLPGKMPADIKIHSITEVAPEFNARFSAIWRKYEYRISFKNDIFRHQYQWNVRHKPDTDRIDQEIKSIIGVHDFTSFCKGSSLKEDNRCDVQECYFDWTEFGGIMHIKSNRFLHHMVRNLVGALYEIGIERSLLSIAEILESKDRSLAGTMASASGLYMADVGYPEELLKPATEE